MYYTDTMPGTIIDSYTHIIDKAYIRDNIDIIIITRQFGRTGTETIKRIHFVCRQPARPQ